MSALLEEEEGEVAESEDVVRLAAASGLSTRPGINSSASP